MKIWSMLLSLAMVLVCGYSRASAQTLPCEYCQPTQQPGGQITFSCARSNLGSRWCILVADPDVRCIVSADTCIAGGGKRILRLPLKADAGVLQDLRGYGVVVSWPSGCEAPA